VNLRLVLHREIPEDPELHRQWNALVWQMDSPEVFYTCEWALAVQSADRATLQPWLLLGYEDDRLYGVASLATDPAGKEVSFLAANTGDYCDFLTRGQDRENFVEGVLKELARIPGVRIRLTNLPAESPTVEALRGAAKKHGMHLFLRPAYSCARVTLSTEEQRQKLKIEVSRKQMFQRKMRSLQQAGTVSFAHLKSWVEIEPALPGFAEAHAARFLATGRASSLATPERRAFLHDLARRFSDSGVVTLNLLKVNDQPVAWNYGFQFAGSWFWYQPTFDGRWEEHSPGYCLLAQIVMEACGRKDLTAVDLGLGDEGYKARFGNSVRQTLHATATRSRARHLAEVARYRMASSLKKSPSAESAVRGALRGLRFLRKESSASHDKQESG
jgi:CelD/BcsL family acetyltransferase involved in cellulose biosynthesis